MREAAEALSRAAGTLSPRSNDHRAPRAPTGKELGETRETHLGGQPRHDHRLEGRRRATSGVVPQSPGQPRRHLRRYPHARDGHQRPGRVRQDLDPRRPCLCALRDVPGRSREGIFWEAVTPVDRRTVGIAGQNGSWTSPRERARKTVLFVYHPPRWQHASGARSRLISSRLSATGKRL